MITYANYVTEGRRLIERAVERLAHVRLGVCMVVEPLRLSDDAVVVARCQGMGIRMGRGSSAKCLCPRHGGVVI